MKLELKRIFKGDTYTIGRLYIEGQYFCDTLEDKVRWDRMIEEQEKLLLEQEKENNDGVV